MVPEKVGRTRRKGDLILRGILVTTPRTPTPTGVVICRKGTPFLVVRIIVSVHNELLPLRKTLSPTIR